MKSLPWVRPTNAARRPLLSLSISTVANHLAIAEVSARTIAEKTAMHVEMTPADFKILSETAENAMRLLGVLALAQRSAVVLGDSDSLIVAEHIASQMRVVRESRNGAEIDGYVRPHGAAE